jgi:hypothetical protein
MRWSDYLAELPDRQQAQLVNALTFGIIQLQHAVRLHGLHGPRGPSGTSATLLGALGLVHASFAEVVRLLGYDPSTVVDGTPDHPGLAAAPAPPLDEVLQDSLVDALGRAVRDARCAAEGILVDGEIGECVARLRCALDALRETRSILALTEPGVTAGH